MNGYLLVIAALVVTGGRLGDIFGRRAVFTIGLAIFAAGSVLSGAAWSEGTLIAGRVVQGIGAAAMLPLSLAIVCDAFPGEKQARALGIWAAISALALAIGPLDRRPAGGRRLAADLLDQRPGAGSRGGRDARGRARDARRDARPTGSTSPAWCSSPPG